MKKFTLLTATTFLIVLLSACNNDDVSDAPADAPVEGTGTNTTQNETNQATGEAIFNFTSFDLDVDYNDNKEFDVNYEHEQDGMEAEITNTVTNNNLKGDEAFNELRPIFEQFTFNKDTSNEGVITEVLSAFNLNGDYQSFELEVTFEDGTEKKY